MDTQCSICHAAAARFLCVCVTPPLAVCTSCLAPHIETEGAHLPSPLQKKAASIVHIQGQANEICDNCSVKPAIRFCICIAPIRKYCDDCDIAHYRKAPLIGHWEHPMSAYAAIASGSISVEAFKEKQQFITNFLLRLGQELRNFDAFVDTVSAEFDNLLMHVTAKKEAVLRDLQTQRTKLAEILQTAHQMVEAKRYAESFAVETALDEVILNGYLFPKAPALNMFTGKVDMKEVQKPLETSVTFQVASELSLLLTTYEIPVIKRNILRLYHPTTFQMTQTVLSQATRIDRSTAYCYIRIDTLLCCGGETHNEMFEVNVRTRAVERVKDMVLERAWAGIWKYGKDWVYVFGGENGSYLNSAEKYGLADKSWTALRNNMQVVKNCCSVCEHQSSLYISGVHGPNSTSTIEHFDPQSEVFTLLRSDNIHHCSIMCSDSNNLYCIRKNTIERVSLTSPTTAKFTVKATISVVGPGHYYLSCPLVWKGGPLTSVLNPGSDPTGLFCFDPAKPQFTQVLTFTY